MAENLKQVFDANPVVSMQTTDIFYLIRSPYGINNDMAVTWNTILNTILPFIPGGYINNVTGTSAILANNQTYIANNASRVGFLLPATADIGTIIYVVGSGSGGWQISQNANQQIIVTASSSTTLGVGGSVSSTNAANNLAMMCTTPNLIWTVISQNGSFTVI